MTPAAGSQTVSGNPGSNRCRPLGQTGRSGRTRSHAVLRGRLLLQRTGHAGGRRLPGPLIGSTSYRKRTSGILPEVLFAVCGERTSSTHLLATPNNHPLSGPQRRSHIQFAAAPSSGRPPGAKHSSQTVQPQKRAEGKCLRLLRLFSALWKGPYECCCKKRCTSSRSGMEPAAPRRVTARAAAAAACRMASAGESF